MSALERFLKDIYIYLTPCVPLSLKGEGEDMKEGLTPLLNSPFYSIG